MDLYQMIDAALDRFFAPSVDEEPAWVEAEREDLAQRRLRNRVCRVRACEIDSDPTLDAEAFRGILEHPAMVRLLRETRKDFVRA